jgi:hypothetical protein
MFLCTYIPLVLVCFCDVAFPNCFLEGIFGFWFSELNLGLLSLFLLFFWWLWYYYMHVGIVKINFIQSVVVSFRVITQAWFVESFNISFFNWAESLGFKVGAKWNKDLGCRLGGVIWTSLKMVDFAFSPTPKWQQASESKSNVKVALMDHYNPILPCHFIISILYILH